MKGKTTRRTLSFLLALTMALSMVSVTYAAPKNKKPTVETVEAVSYDTYDTASIKVSEQPNHLPLTGYFEKQITVGDTQRPARVYLGENAPVASYFTVVGVPAGTDTTQFLTEAGWFDYADRMQEGLLILEDNGTGWANAADNKAYVDAAMTWLLDPKVNGTAVFSTYGIFYFVGYGRISSALEQWAAENPMRAIAQAYVDTEGLSAAVLNEIGSVPAKEMGRTEFEILPDQRITLAEMTIPTWYRVKNANKIKDSLAYWKYANDVLDKAEKKGKVSVYHQKQDSKRWPTLHWNSIMAADTAKYGKYGLSQVVVNTTNAAYTSYTQEITDFLRQYISYGNTTEYNKQLSVRADFEAMGVEIRTIRVEPVKGHALREYMLYIPQGTEEAYGEKGAPLVIVNAGAGTTDRNFFNGSQWWQVAEEGKFILVFMCEDNATPTTLTYADTDIFLDAVLDEVIAQHKVDESRIYLSGHSAGSGTSQAIAALYPQRFAALATTSAIPDMEDTAASFEGMFGGAGRTYGEKTGGKIPNMFMYGEGDRPELHDGIWYSNHTDSPYYAEADLTKCTEALVKYHLNNWNLPMGEEGTKTCAEYQYATTVPANPEHGYESWNWTVTAEGVEVPVLRVNRVQNIGHTNNNNEFPLLWDYLKHFATEDGVRYYSASAFAEDDAVEIARESRLGTPVKFDDSNKGVEDITRGNALVHNGYFTQDVTVGEETRTMKLYIGKDAPIRCYFTIVNVPAGEDTALFLEKTGWADLADERGEGIFVLEPGDEGWGSYEEEKAYLTAAFANFNTKTWYSNFSTHYMVGYGEGGQLLQQYAMENPMAIIGGVFVNASEIDGDFMEAAGSAQTWACNDRFWGAIKSDITFGEIPMPVWLINSESSEKSEAVAAYWQKANDCEADGAALEDGSVEYAQKADSDRLSTSYSDTRSKVRIQKASPDIYDASFTREAYDFMKGYTKYETTAVGGHALGARPDYAELGIETFDLVVDDLVREYLIYVPESVKQSGEKAPMVMLFGGSGQPNRVIFDATHWWEIAQREGFIVCAPCSYSQELRWNNTGDPNKRDDLKFILTVLEECADRYPVDTTRVYATGQSNGAVTTQFLASQAPEYFAAAAATSGGLIENSLYAEDNGKAQIPMYLLFGQYDNWTYDFHENDMDIQVRTLVKYFNQRNESGDVDEPDTKTEEGRFTTYGWKNAAGQTMVQLTQTQGRPHNCIPSEMELIWKWFANWSRVDGELVSAEKTEPIIRQDENGYYHCGTRVEDGRTVLDQAVPFESLTIPAFDNMRSNDLPFVGYYTQNVIDGRTMKVYIPEGMICGHYSVLITVPEGQTAEAYLQNYGWIAEADKKQFSIVALEPGEAGWGTADEEYAYVNAAFNNLKSDKYFKTFAAYYFVGYGEAGTALQRVSLTTPITMAGAVYVNASNITPEQLAQAGATKYVDKKHSGEAFENGLTYGDTPVPVWIMEDEADANSDAVIAYWKKANLAGSPVNDATGRLEIYEQEEDSIFTPCGRVTKTILSPDITEELGEGLAAELYEHFLSLYTRYNNAALASTLAYRADFEAMEAAGNLKFYEEEIDGYLRRWLVYVPDGVKNGKAGEKFPVIFSLHGSGSTYKTQFDNLRWWEDADRENFILVMPTATMTVTAMTPEGDAQTKIPRGTWNNSGEEGRVDDVAFIEKVAARVDAEYPTDTTRRYISGQSNGAVMSSYLAMHTPQTFAAMAATSGGLITDSAYEEANENEKIPAYLLFGQYDLWTVDFPLAELEGDYQVRKLVKYWVDHNEVGDVDAPDVNGVTSQSESGLYSYVTYGWQNGQDIPLVQYTITRGRAHSVEVDENVQMYNWFMKWTREEDGSRYYEGVKVQTESSVPATPLEPAQPTHPLAPVITIVRVVVKTIFSILRRFF